MIVIVDPHPITMDDVRAEHAGHVGFIWECPICRGAWQQLKIQEEKNIMHTGMLWFDNSTTTLSVKIQKAVDYYQKKYNRTPDLVLVHPSMLVGNVHLSLTMNVRPYKAVLPGHIWIGIEDKN
jgi:hypothetical protein